MRNLKIIKFWIVAFSVIIWQTLKGNTWHTLIADIEVYVDKDDPSVNKRKRLIARRTYNSLDIFWQDMIAPRDENA